MSENFSLNNFDEIKKVFASFPELCEKSKQLAKDYNDELIKPVGSLGKLEELSFWLSSVQARHPATITRPRVAVFAGNHGIAKHNVSSENQSTAEMVLNFQNNATAVNQLCKQYDTELRVYEMGLDNPTNDFTEKPAMSEDECVNAIAYGMTTVEPGVDILCVGEVGVASSISATAVASALFGDIFENKTNVIEQGIKQHKDNFTINGKVDGLKVLQHLGGLEMCGVLGAIIAARMANVPVIIDGFNSVVAMSVLYCYDPKYIEHCVISSSSGDKNHDKLLQKINKQPLLDFDISLGGATGSVLVLGLLKSALNCHNGIMSKSEIKK